jgi:hypothetical protein
MSAFIVDHDTIDALLTLAVGRKVSYYVAATETRVQITAHNAEEVGRLLLTENERSVYHRYPDSKAGNLPGRIGEDVSSYRFRFIHAPLPAVVVLKSCDCFDYQACETDDYETSLAHAIVHAIRKECIRALPGYDGAPWGYVRPAPVRAPLASPAAPVRAPLTSGQKAAATRRANAARRGI